MATHRDVAAKTVAGPAAQPPSFASGRYLVRHLLGEGGQKTVFLAHDSQLDRDVALAWLKAEGLDEGGIARVRREAQAMAQLEAQPHIVAIYDIGEHEGRPFTVCEYMAGGDLCQAIQQAGGQLPLDQALRVAQGLCQALVVAHGQGILHRDIKPANIWLTDDGRAKLGDFGLAMAIGRSRMTQAGTIMGTAAYMPPEQALGGEVNARSDLYSFGCVLYEMLTGRPPFLGDDTIAIVSQHINTAPVAPSWHNAQVPRSLETLIVRLLAKAPDDRPVSAEAVMDELLRIEDHSSEEPAVVVPLTPTLGGLEWGHFVGRREEMDQLKTALENELSGHGSLIMLVGEPGIGKTRLAEEFGVYATLRGAQVLTGRCYEGEAALPYRPFVEAFRQYVHGRPDPVLRDELGEGAPEIAKLVSEVGQRFPDIPESPPLEAEAERLRLFESLAAFLRNAALAQPLVLFLDDIHWADKPSLLLLRYLTRALANERVLLLAAYRDIELDRTHPLAEIIAALRREQPYQRVRLHGLSEEDILALLTVIESSEETAPGRQALAGGLFQETEGNPFFIHEVLAHLIETGKIVREDGRWVARAASISELGIPEGVREVIGRRLSRMSEGGNRMLTCASTMTGGFTWEELCAITGEPESSLLDTLDEALAAQLVQERKGETGRYDFTHALIRQTLYDELSTPRRVLLHRQIGQALEELYADNLDPHLAELAHHFCQAAPGGDVDKAIEYARRAADDATRRVAYDVAVTQYEHALQALELKGQADSVQRCELLLALGESLWQAGDGSRGQETLAQAAAIARQLNAPEQLARAATSFGGTLYVPFVPNPVELGLLEEALELLGERDSRLRALVLTRLAVALARTDPKARALSLADQAVTLARSLGDTRALPYALLARYWTSRGSDLVEDRLDLLRESIQLAEEAGDAGVAYLGRWFSLTEFLELGDLISANAQMMQVNKINAQRRQPFETAFLAQAQPVRPLSEGRFEEAERLAQEGMAAGNRWNPVQTLQTFGAQIFLIRREQGRLLELEPLLQQVLAQEDALAVWRCVLAFFHSEVGNRDDARREFDLLASNQCADIPRDFFWLTAITLLAETCSFLGDAGRAAALYELMAPYAERNIVVGGTALIASLGSGSRYLGNLAATMGRWDEAVQHFEAALEMNTRMGARPWVAHTQYDYARMLLARGAAGDREPALELLQPALDAAREMGMKALEERALALKLQLQGEGP